MMGENAKYGDWLRSVCSFLTGQVYASFLKNERPIATLEAPVQHGKTTVLRHFICWLIGHSPELRYNYYTSSDKLKHETQICIDIILKSEKYQSIFGKRKNGLKLQDNIEGFQITNDRLEVTGGRCDFRLMGGGNIGHPSNVSIIDDPYGNKEEATSLIVRDKIESRFRADVISRRQEKSMVIVMHSRWHVNDLIGYIKENLEGVFEFSTPAISPEGKPVFPELRSIDFLNEQRKIMNEEEFMALYQQSPITAGGNLFKREMFGYGCAPEGYDYKFITADTAYKDKISNDWTVFTAFGSKDGQLYVDDVMREKIKASEIEAKAIPFIQKHTSYGFRGAYIEPKGHGIYLNQKLPSLGVVMPSESDVIEFFKDRKHDKVMRANNIIPYLSNKKVIINENITLKEVLIEEVISFPRGRHDDFVDTLIDGIKYENCRGYSILDVL
jgi:predicted phage terminase large subunit-like protein